MLFHTVVIRRNAYFRKNITEIHYNTSEIKIFVEYE